jgi:hypothetical protein
MRRTLRHSIAAALAGVLVLAAVAPAAARYGGHWRGGGGYHRHHGNSLRAFGFVAGAIVGVVAAEQARRNCRYYGHCYYGYGPYYR